MLTKPADEIADHGIAPHPGREPLKPAQRFFGRGVASVRVHKPVDACGIRPVALDRDRLEPLVLDQPFRHFGSGGIELVCSVRALADQHDVRRADQISETVHGRNPAGRADRALADQLRRVGGRSRHSDRRGGHQCLYLVVGDLCEVPIGRADGMERRRNRRAHHLVDHRPELTAGRFRCGGNSDHDAPRLLGADRLDRREHAGAGGQAVVDEDHCSSRDIERTAPTAIGGFPALEFGRLCGGHRANLVGGQAQRADDVVGEDDAAAGRQGAEGELRIAGYAQFADDQGVQRRVQGGGDFPGHGDPAARKPEHDHALAPSIMAE